MNLRYEVHLKTDAAPAIRYLMTTEGLSIDDIQARLSTHAPVDAVDPLARFRKAARRPGRPIRVVALHPERAYVQPVYSPRVGEVFDSLSDFCEAIGARPTNTSTALTQARGRGQATAVVRGVEFGYVDVLPRTAAGLEQAATVGPVAARAAETLTVTNPSPAVQALLRSAPPGITTTSEERADGVVVATATGPGMVPPSMRVPPIVLRRLGPNTPRILDRPAAAPTPNEEDTFDSSEPPPETAV